VLHLVGQGLEQGGLPGPRGSQQQGHAARQDGTADVVQDDEAVLAGADANQAQPRLHANINLAMSSASLPRGWSPCRYACALCEGVASLEKFSQSGWGEGPD